MNTGSKATNYRITDVYNPIIDAAKPVFVLSNAMKTTTTHLSIENVLFKFSKLIEEFEAEAERKGAPYEMVKAAKYCLCTFVDEQAVRSEWANENWAQKSLLVSFFDETWGGERFFEILEKAKLDPNKNLYLIEFIYLCLQFGYKGKYQILNNGDIELQKENKILLDIINSNRPDVFSTLFNNVSSESIEEIKKDKFYIPLWVIAVLLSLVIGVFYIGFRWVLGNSLDKTSMEINNLNLPKNAPYRAKEYESFKAERLTPVLENEIQRGLIVVKDLPDRSVITMLGDGLFESGSENIQDKYFPVLATIGQALESVKGQIVVTGYTDDTPIKSINFPSNWHLSQARADAVKEILLKYISNSSRVRSEGRGSTSPVEPNDSSENKAKNRRVEITIFSISNDVLNNENKANESKLSSNSGVENEPLPETVSNLSN